MGARGHTLTPICNGWTLAPNWLTYEQEANICDMLEETTGFGTGLKRENPKVKAPIGSPDLECFLKQLIGGRIAKTISR
jgi:hypothetical protein